MFRISISASVGGIDYLVATDLRKFAWHLTLLLPDMQGVDRDTWPPSLRRLAKGLLLQLPGRRPKCFTNIHGNPLDAPFDTTTPVDWIGYANPSIRTEVETTLQALIAEWRIT